MRDVYAVPVGTNGTESFTGLSTDNKSVELRTYGKPLYPGVGGLIISFDR